MPHAMEQCIWICYQLPTLSVRGWGNRRSRRPQIGSGPETCVITICSQHVKLAENYGDGLEGNPEY